MSVIKDEAGKRYSKLTVVSFAGVIGRYATFLCRCDCGNETIVRGSDLRTGNTKSCGKCKKERHGMSRSRLYNIWIHIKMRTQNPSTTFFEDYGGRGISVCEEWANSFSSFSDWAKSSGYSDDLTIERIDVNGNYCPDNCKWIPIKDQANNRRTTVNITFNGKTMNLTQWADHLGMNRGTLQTRYKNGWSVEDMLTREVRTRR